MGYYIDLSKISLDEFKSKLETSYLLPSQQILKDKINENFEKIKNTGIQSMQQLQQVLKTKERVNDFAKLTSLEVDYLTVLRRTVNSYHPEARKIKEFTCINEKTKKSLENIGIKTTLDLYDKIINIEERNKLKDELNIGNEEALLLAKITDVCRLRYVNHTFATLLVNSEYNTVEKIKKADYKEMYNDLMRLNQEKKIFNGKIGLNDMKFLVNDTTNISIDIEY